MPVRLTSRLFILHLLAGFFWSLPGARAQNRILATYGDMSGICDAPSRLLREYSIATRHFADLKNQNADRFLIQDAKSAIDSVAGSLDPERAGVIAIVEKEGPRKFTPNVPKIEINGQSKDLAQVVVVGVEPDSNQLSLTQEKTQMRIDFRLLGICSFVPPGGPLTRRDLQRAVDSLLGK